MGEAASTIYYGRGQTGTAARAIILTSVLGGPALGIFRNPRNVVRAWKVGASTLASFTELKGTLPALGPDHKLGIRFGSQEMSTLGEMHLIDPTMPEASLPFPNFGFGFTAVPNTSSRLVYEAKKSRPGEHTGRTSRVAGPLQTGKSMPGASAKKSTRRSRRSKPARRMRARKWCRRHKRYDRCK